MSATLLRRMSLGCWLVVFILSSCGSNGSDASSHSEDGAAGSDNASGGGTHASGGASDGTAGAGAQAVPIVINELMASNSRTVGDGWGAYPDWIELYNPTDEDVDLGGYYASDDPENPTRVQLPEGLTIEAKGYLLLWADNDTEEGKSHLPFKLAAEGEAALLAGPDGQLLDSVEYGSAQQDYSYARFPNAVGNFAWCSTATPGDPNPDQCPSGSTGQDAGSSTPSDAGSD
ncbi:MAG: lamin tail domain-containing protein [Polyangiaceae bacterium]|nr:lamin tail domain-containing protein [Polyangiaceae bacterium]